MAPQPAAVMRAGSPNRPLNGSPAEQRPTFPGLFNRGIFSANRPGGRSSREGGPQVAGEGITLKAPNPLQGRGSCSSFSKHLSLALPFGDSSELVTWRSEEDSELRVGQRAETGPRATQKVTSVVEAFGNCSFPLCQQQMTAFQDGQDP